jgi:hypothetical protein
MLRETIKQIIFAEKQAEFYETESSKRYKMWMAEAYILRRSIGEFRPWHQLIAIFDLRGEV